MSAQIFSTLVGINLQNEIFHFIKSHVQTGHVWMDGLVLTLLSGLGFFIYQNYTKIFYLSQYIKWNSWPHCIEICQPTKYESDDRDRGANFLNNNENFIMIKAILKFIQDHELISKKSKLYIKLDPSTKYIDGLQKPNYLIIPDAPIYYQDLKIQFIYNSVETEVKEQSKTHMQKNNFLNIIVAAKAKKSLQNFLENTYKEYIKLKYPKIEEEKCIYFHKLYHNTKDYKFSQYRFTSTKTFNSIFFPEKSKVLKILSDFKTQQGFYRPDLENSYKLGILLHGPPGTGKTSFIKALANYFKRSIFKISINHIKTAHDFEKLFFAKSYLVEDSNDSFYDCLDLSDRIYVFEDVDTETQVLNTRKTQNTADSLLNLDNVITSIDSNEEKSDTDVKKKFMSMMGILHEKDPINLGTFLNCLDGLLEPHGLIYIFTTNHPEKLDPAFKRPGRIHLELKLDYCDVSTIIEIINYHFQKKNKLNQTPYTMLTCSKIKSQKNWSGAEIENLCQTMDNAEQIVKCINDSS